MVCTNCKRVIHNPVDHEFCTFKLSPEEAATPVDTRSREQKIADNMEAMKKQMTFSVDYEVESGGERPHYPSKQPIPEQRALVHNLAPKGAAPPKHGHDSYTGNFGGRDELTDDSYSANARNIFENL